MKKFFLLVIVLGVLCSCESIEERERRLAQEEQWRLERQIEEKKREEEERIFLEGKEKERKAEELKVRLELEKEEERIRLEREEQERKEALIRQEYNNYINNSLSTGATPYRRYYGGNSSCNDFGCSKISVRTPNSSDVLVTIKRNGIVVRHAYIQKSNSYTFSMPNGEYQVFFYYGKGWNPNKVMGKGDIVGGFISNEIFSKDNPQFLNNNILEYELILQQNGNFSTKPSSEDEMF